MTDISAKAREVYVDGVYPAKGDIHDLFDAVKAEIAAGTTGRTPHVATVSDSWFYIDTPTDSLRQAIIAALVAKNGSAPYFSNDAIGGTTIYPAAGQANPSAQERLPGITKYGDILGIISPTGLNDLALAHAAGDYTNTLANMKLGHQALAAASPWYAPLTVPPFKGAAFYNATTRGIADALRTWLLATYPGKVIDLWTILNNPADDGALLAAYDDGTHYHILPAGKTAVANAIVNGAGGQPALTWPAAPTSAKVRATRDVTLTQNLDGDSVPAFKGMILGQDDGQVGVLTLRADDPLNPKKHIFWAQPNSATAGFFGDAGVDGNLTFSHLDNPTLVQRFLLSGTAAGTSLISTKLQVAAEGLAFRVSQATFGGGIGGALDTSVTATAITQSALGTGGNSYIGLVQETSALTVCGYAGSLDKGRINLNAAGTAGLYFDTAGLVLAGLSYFLPATDNSASNGAPGNRWSVVYAATGTINTSDIRWKTDIKPLATAFGGGFASGLVDAVDPISFRFVDGENVVSQVQKRDENGALVFDLVEEQIVDDVTEDKAETVIDLVAGEPVARIVIRQVPAKRPRVIMVPLLGPDGAPVIDMLPDFDAWKDRSKPAPMIPVPRLHPVPVMHMVEKPVMIDQIETRAGRRLHLGFSAQDMEARIRAAGVDDPWSLALLTRDDPNDPESRRGLRETHLIAMLWQALRETRAEIAALKAKRR